ncbi:MAG TPA: hypothetical protein VF245_06250 [Solirubrobacterales bacterium]
MAEQTITLTISKSDAEVLVGVPSLGALQRRGGGGLRRQLDEKLAEVGAHRHIPGSRLEVFEDVGHLPQVEAPLRFVHAPGVFLAETEPASLSREDWEGLIQRHEAA